MTVDVYTGTKGYDPTRTTHLRNRFVGDLRKRFRALRGLIREVIVEDEVFGVNQPFTSLSKPGRRAFAFDRSGKKVGAFMDWLNVQAEAGILEARKIAQAGQGVEAAWTNVYINDSYKRGVQRATYELRNAGYNVPGIDERGGIDAVMNQPFHADRVGLLYTRTFSDLKGITEAMDGQISRVLSQSMADGDGPREIARRLNRVISGPSGDLGLTDTLGRFIPAERRAVMLARTEIIRAHHSAMVQEYRNWEAEGVRVRAEWQTAAADRVCPDCLDLENSIYTLDQIEGMIPLHPQCRCIALPVKIKDR